MAAVAVVVPGAAALMVPAVIPEVSEVVQVPVVSARSHQASLLRQAAQITSARRLLRALMDLEVVPLRDRRTLLGLAWMYPISPAPGIPYRRR